MGAKPRKSLSCWHLYSEEEIRQSPSKHIYKQENVITVSVMRKTKLDNMVETGKGLLELGRLEKASLTGEI